MTAPDRIWYNGHTQHMRELRHSPPTSNAHPQVEYIRADLTTPAPATIPPEVTKLVEAAACAAVDWANGDYGMSAEKAAGLGVYRFVKRRTLAALRAGENNGK